MDSPCEAIKRVNVFVCVPRHSVVLAVRSVSGRIWKFPIILVATEPQVDDVILTEATELDKTSAGGVPLTTILGELFTGGSFLHGYIHSLCLYTCQARTQKCRAEMEIETQFSFGAEIFIFGTRKCCRVTQPSSTGQNSGTVPQKVLGQVPVEKLKDPKTS